MANPRTPRLIKLLKGTVQPCRELPDAIEIPRDLSEPPGWLTDEQREVWTESISAVPPGMLKQLDAPALITWILAQAAQKRAALAWQIDGLSVVDDKGKVSLNPDFAAFKAASELILRAGAELGFTPVSRGKVKIADPRKPEAGFGRFREAKATFDTSKG